MQFILKFIFQNLTILFRHSLLFKIKMIICRKKGKVAHKSNLILKIKINFLNVVKCYNYDIYYKFHVFYIIK